MVYDREVILLCSPYRMIHNWRLRFVRSPEIPDTLSKLSTKQFLNTLPVPERHLQSQRWHKPFARQAIGCNHIIVALYVDDAKVVAMVEQLVLNSSRKPEDVLIHRIIITVQHQNTIIVALEIVALNHTIITSVKYQIFTSVGINLIIDERKFVHFLHLASNPRRLSTQLAVLHNNIFTANQLDTIREFGIPSN